MKHSVFISYANADRDKKVANAICSTLESRGIGCWIAPRDLPPGESYPDEIIRAINVSRAMVMVFSSSANVSQDVKTEVERARAKHIPVIPFRIEDVPLSAGFEYLMSICQWLDATSPPLEARLIELAHRVEALAASWPTHGRGAETGRDDNSAQIRVRKSPSRESARLWARLRRSSGAESDKTFGEKALSDLKRFEASASPETATIRQGLKSPEKIDHVEEDLQRLKAKIAEPEATRRVPDETTVGQKGLLFPPALTGIYRDTSYIGGGGFAHVFKARRKRDGVEVAIKVPVQLDAPTGRSFLNEVISWNRLSHENICKLRDLNILPTPYLEMELCQGSLDDLKKPLSVDQAASLIYRVAEGVGYAHSKGVSHRNLKSRNILFRGDIPVVSDWGLSKPLNVTSSSEVHGLSPFYAAPEQIEPTNFGNADHRTDIYQLGVVFYELVTGQLPFGGRDLTEIMGQITMADPKKPSHVNPEASKVEPIVMKCLHKDMKLRYQTIAELQKDLACCLETASLDLRPTPGHCRPPFDNTEGVML